VTGLLQHTFIATLPAVPKRLVEPFARPYVAGETLEQADAVVNALASAGRVATLDVLAEELRTPVEVEALVATYIEILRRPAPSDPPPTLSIRMTALGLRIDPRLPWGHLERLAATAKEAGRRLTIDMEDLTTLDATLKHYERLRAAGHDHVGIVLQAYLRRTPRDMARLSRLTPRVRVVKGIWVEPASVAYDDAEIIRRCYVRILDRLFATGCYVEIATHDERLVAEALYLVERHGLTPDRYEFQMLLGVRSQLGEMLVADGHTVRVYVPFGRDWHSYSMRRLRESPDVAKHVLQASVARLLGRERRLLV
jgi:proline dehydrogenase